MAQNGTGAPSAYGRNTNARIAQLYARGAERGRSGHGTLYISGPVIYSYGRHWPIAVRLPDGEVALNVSKYSTTTGMHRQLVARALVAAGIVPRPVELDEARALAEEVGA